ncbi:unnamed protein product [Spirodela intermedia]|uniref:C2 domain-containing protein n=1 Tax=Spirodela intermedia TaxID=51605 RepID=A0A7I8IKT4_SPIIN|nr:unnamed protein product [Spirodela intermedia]CAA6658473.1 unnamed protein product [Spirodela intermedia]
MAGVGTVRKLVVEVVRRGGWCPRTAAGRRAPTRWLTSTVNGSGHGRSPVASTLLERVPPLRRLLRRRRRCRRRAPGNRAPSRPESLPHPPEPLPWKSSPRPLSVRLQGGGGPRPLPPPEEKLLQLDPWRPRPQGLLLRRAGAGASRRPSAAPRKAPRRRSALQPCSGAEGGAALRGGGGGGWEAWRGSGPGGAARREAAMEAGKPVEAGPGAAARPDAAVEAGKAGEAADQMAAPPAGEGVVPQEDLTKEEAAAMEQQLLQPPPPWPQRQVGSEEGGVERSSFDLVDKMQYLFVRVVKARSLPGGAANPPHVRIAVSGRSAATGPAMTRAHPTSFEWDHTFAFPRPGGAADQEELPAEVSVWDGPPVESPAAAPGKRFLGSVRLDVSEVSDGPPAAQPTAAPPPRAPRSTSPPSSGISVSRWSTPTASFPSLGDGGTAARRPRVGEGDAGVSVPENPQRRLGPRRNPSAADIVGGPAVRGGGATGDQAVEIAVEARRRRRHGEEPATVLGCAHVALSAVERRVDDRHVALRWLDLLPPPAGGEEAGGAAPRGRLQVRVCLDGGYHVTDEPPHAASDFRPSARQLWRRPVGAVELGIIGCRNLLPVKSTVGTAAYVVAKYGSKWARTRTVATSVEPTWNEQYTWPIFDPATVLTVAVFDESTTACRPLGRVRIRISALESGCAYRISYPLFLLRPTGLHRTGEIDLAVRFARAGSPLDILHVYGQPVLPLMHHLRPIGGLRRDHLRSAAARLVAAHLARSEPSLPNEAVMHVLEADGESRGGFSMRRMRASWNRAAAALSWVASVARWMESMRTWRNPTATILAHGVLVLLIWHPDLIVPAVAIHVAMVGVWNRRKSARGAASTGHVCLRASQLEATAQLADELDEELDPSPSAKPPEVVRARYDRLRAAVWRGAAPVAGDVARSPRHGDLRGGLSGHVGRPPGGAHEGSGAAAGFYWLRHPVFRGAAAAAAPPRALNFFRRLPTLSDRIM